MNSGTNVLRSINQVTLRRRAVRPVAEILYAAYYGYGNADFLGCFREVENAILARRKHIPREPPKYPQATIRPLGGTRPYRLLDDHGGWRQQLCFADPEAARMFIRALRAIGCNGSGEKGTDDP